MAKRVLIITYYWPPAGGSPVQRWLKFVRYLPEFGWEPIVYTAADAHYPVVDQALEAQVPEHIDVVRRPIWEPYKLFSGAFFGRSGKGRVNPGLLQEGTSAGGWRKTLGLWVRGNFFIPDARRFWIRPSVKFLSAHLRQHPVDLIISSGPPHSCHLIARKLHRDLGIPWIADFRDPWTSMDYYHEMHLSARADREHHRLEKAVITEASAVVVVGNAMRQEFEAYGRPVQVITNGFDPADAAQVTAPPDERFTLVHVGSLMKNRDPYSLWRVLGEQVRSDAGFAADLRIKLVGKVDNATMASLQRNGLVDHVEIIPQVSYAEALRAQSSAQVLLLLIDKLPNAEFVLSNKLFEYLQAGRPVLGIGPVHGDAAAVVHDTGAGVLLDFDDHEGIRKAVLALHERYRTKAPYTRPGGIDRYARRSLTQDLVRLMDELTT